jgi:hypothetical protein
MIGLYLVGAVIGLLLLVAAIAEWDGSYGLWDVDATRAIFGERAARWFCGLIGVAILVMTGLYWAKVV